MFIITAKCSKRRVVKILLIFALLLSLFLALRACRHSSPPPVIAAGTNEERIAYLASLGWEVNDQPDRNAERHAGRNARRAPI